MYWVELHWDELYWLELYWVSLYWVEFHCTELSFVVFRWFVFSMIAIALYCASLTCALCVILTMHTNHVSHGFALIGWIKLLSRQSLPESYHWAVRQRLSWVEFWSVIRCSIKRLIQSEQNHFIAQIVCLKLSS